MEIELRKYEILSQKVSVKGHFFHTIEFLKLGKIYQK